MAAAFPSEAMQRLNTMRRVTVRRDALSAEPDPVKPGGWIVRNAATPYRIELVNADGQCSCVAYTVQGRCAHTTLIRTITALC